jgi:putative nucleotidyltransferase with HDIG domain
MSKKSWLRVIAYRLGQVRQQLGLVTPLSVEERAEVERWLPVPAWKLFDTMSAADQRHALRVCRGLQERGCADVEMLAAALLHDVGKAQGRVPFWTRPAIVIGKRVAPGLLSRLTSYPVTGKGWRRSLSYAWHHADVGADLAEAAGLSPRAVLYIRTHHQPDGPAAQLHVVDEVS